MLFGQELGARLAEAHGAARAALHLAQEEDIDADQNQDGQPAHENAAEIDTLFRRPGIDPIDVLDQERHQRVVGRRIGGELLDAVARLTEGPGDRVAADAHILDLTLIDGVHEVRIGDGVGRDAVRAALEHAVKQREQQDDDDPKGGVTIERVHVI